MLGYDHNQTFRLENLCLYIYNDNYRVLFR
jgi:hypothetical protein